MNKKYLIIGLLLCGINISFAQVGINNSNPQGIFHVDGGKDNPAAGIPSALQQKNDFFITSEGNVGTGTIAPAQRLDVAGGNVRIRDINTNAGDVSNKLVVADADGILKVAGDSGFSTTDSGNRILRVAGGSDYSFITNWQDETVTPLPLNEAYDPQNAYDPVTGEFTVPQDGLYHFKSRVRLQVGSGTFNGDGGLFSTGYGIDDNTKAEGNSGANDIRVIRGTFISGFPNFYDSQSQTTIWLKAGQKIKLIFFARGTANMADNNNVHVIRDGSYFRINKLL
jgi:hypothetical protein